MQLIATRLLAAVTLAVVFTSTALAVGPDSISYQGRLTDNVGDPENGSFSLTFTIWDAAAGGSQLWTETQPAVSVSDGLFNVWLGAVNPLGESVFDGNDTYLGVTVGADPEIMPRTRFVAVPYSHRVTTIDGSSGGAVTGETDITADALGEALGVSQLGLGRGGFFQISNGSNTEAAVQGTHVGAGPGGSFFSDGGGPGVRAFASGGLAADLQGRVHTSGDIVSFDGADSAFQVDVSNAMIRTFGSDGLEQARLWGNSYGEIFLNDNTDNDRTVTLSAQSNGGGMLELTDEDGVAEVLMVGGNTGDNIVSFPQDAINAEEQLEEPGIANRIQSSTSIVLTGGSGDDILIRTITAPTDGYVVAFASGSADVIHNNGNFSGVDYGIVAPGGTLNGSPTVRGTISGNAPSGSYDIPLAVTAAFSVTAGAQQFRIQAQDFSAGGAVIAIEYSQLTLMFIPTLYGVFSSNNEPAPPLLSQDADEEAEEARLFNQQRLNDELASIRAKLDAVQSQLEGNNSQE